MSVDYVISQFLGLNTAVKDTKKIAVGASPDSLNWITGKYNDHIELRRGTAYLGATQNTGNGKITGIGKGIRYDGVEVPFFSYGQKLKYYNVTLNDTVEIGSNILPIAANEEDLWFQSYQNLAGSFVYCGSPNSSVYKIVVANPGNAVDQLVPNFHWGVYHIGQNRAFAGQRSGATAGNADKTGLYLSYIDKALLSDFSQTAGESFGTGDGITKTFTHTLSAFTAADTAMYPSVTDSNETFTDDRNGNMIGNKGGTGTINYATGIVSVTFNTAPTMSAAITISYYLEDATSTGILDFTGGLNGEGKSFRQDDGGGNIMAIYNLNTIEYCFHLLKTWQLQTSLDDTQSTNLPYRLVGIPHPRAAFEEPEGILFADLSRPNEPKFRRLQVLAGTTNNTIEPVSISDALDLSGYAFDYCVAFRWGDYEIFCFQEKVSGISNIYNSKMLIRNTISGSWDLLDYSASCLIEYMGALLAGDSISNNVFTLFSGFDELGDTIPNYWTSGNLDIAVIPKRRTFKPLPSLKTFRRMTIDGLIQKDQEVDIFLSYDSGAFTKVFTISGSGAYVDSGIDTDIGQPTIGSKVIGGGGVSTAHPFEVDFPVNSDKFEFVRIKVVANAIGYVEIDTLRFREVRDKGIKKMPSRTV